MGERKERGSEKTKVSVVIPTYNMGEYVGGAIESVLCGSFNDVEIIVVDDGSTDSTASVVEQYTDSSSESYDSRVRYYWKENQGKSSAVNFGFTLAEGEYITILDADDEFTPDSLESRLQFRYSQDGKPYGLIIGGFEVFDYRGVHGSRQAPNETNPIQLRNRFYLRWKTPFSLNACLIRRELIEEVGGLNEHIHRCIDGDYVLRLFDVVDNVNTVDSVVYRYRKHRSSPIKRAKYRVRTAWYRPQVIWKNYEGFRRWVGVPFGLIMDSGKLIYEMFGIYKS